MSDYSEISDLGQIRKATVVVAVRIRKRNRIEDNGSGYVIDSVGLIVTANHAIPPDHDTAWVKTGASENYYKCKVAERFPGQDIAILQILDGCPPLTSLRVGRAEECRIGELVYFSGYPNTSRHGYQPTIGTGTVGALDASYNGEHDLLRILNAPYGPGMSGGPVFQLSTGRVIGTGINPSPKEEAIGVFYASKLPSDLLALVRRKLPTGIEWDFRGFLGMSGGTARCTVSSFQGVGTNIVDAAITRISGSVSIAGRGMQFPLKLIRHGGYVDSDRLASLPSGEKVNVGTPVPPLEFDPVVEDSFRGLLDQYSPLEVVINTNLGEERFGFSRDDFRAAIRRFTSMLSRSKGPIWKDIPHSIG